MPFIACAVRSQPNTLTLSVIFWLLTAEIGADQRRLAGGVERGHVGIGGHQVFGGGERDVLDVLAVDGVEERDLGAGVGRPPS